MRDEKIDVLRFIGLSLIILAHVGPPYFIYQARNFDVPLMVVVAGLSFRASFKNILYFSYLWGRFKRLVLPMWLFLSFYFTLTFLTGFPIPTPDLNKILSSYFLIEGIGFVWIIRTFLLVAIMAPFIYKYSVNEPSNNRYLSVLTIIYILYEIIFLMYNNFPRSIFTETFKYTILYLISYSILFAIGIRLQDLKKKDLFIIGSITFFIVALWTYLNWTVLGEFIPIRRFKNPPQSYFVAYGLFISLLLWLISDKIVHLLKQKHLKATVFFIAQNSLWVYLWHIFFLSSILATIDLSYQSKYVLVFSTSVLMTWIQVTIVKNHLIPNIQNRNIKNNLSAILTG